MLINKSQFYEVIQYAEDKGISPKLFSFEHVLEESYKGFFGKEKKEELKHPYSVIRLNETDYYFKIKVSKYRNEKLYIKNRFKQEYWFVDEMRNSTDFRYPEYHYYDTSINITASPSVDGKKENYTIYGYENEFNWNKLIASYKMWIDALHDEIKAIKAISKINSLPNFFTDQKYNTEFDSHTEEEKEVIRSKIKQLSAAISDEIDVSKDDLALINHKLEELSNKIDSLNKFDFKTAFFGILVNISSSVLYDNASDFWSIVKRIFNQDLLGEGGKFLL